MGLPRARLRRVPRAGLLAGLLLLAGLMALAESPPGRFSETVLPDVDDPLGQNRRSFPVPTAGSPDEEDPALHPGFPVFLDPATDSQPYTPTLYDIDGDGADEIFVTGQDTFGIRGDGSFLPGWPTTEQELSGYGTNANLPGPSAADFIPGGDAEVLWTTRDWWAADSRLWTFNGRWADGSDLPGFPRLAPGSPSNALWTPFVLGDTDNDGDLEAWSAHTLGNNSIQNRISAMDSSGQLLFTIELQATESVKSLHYGDLDGDGQQEMFATSEIGDQVRLQAFDSNGNSAPGYPIPLINPLPGWLAEGPMVPADLDHDRDLEILLVDFDPTIQVHCVHHDGAACTGFPFIVATNSQPLDFSLGDVNRDGYPELVLSLFDLDTAISELIVFDLSHGSALSGWPVQLPSLPRGVPVVADVSGDSAQDILAVTAMGDLFAIHRSGQMVSGYPKTMISNSISGAAVGDIDADGLLEIVAATWDGWIYAWDTAGLAHFGSLDWPMRGVNPRNTGVYGDIEDLLFLSGFDSGETGDWTSTVP